MEAKIEKYIKEAVKKSTKNSARRKMWLTIRAFVLDCELATFNELERLENELNNEQKLHYNN